MATSSFQYMSDLHLEMRPGLRISPKDVRAPFLILAGDVGDPGTNEYVSFLTHAANLYERVFVVLGNHECYGRRLHRAINLTKALCTRAGRGKDNVLFLNREEPYATAGDRVRVLGCTLWSHVPPEAATLVREGLNDYRAIQGFGIETGNREHEEDVAWLTRELLSVRAAQARCVVVTHHAPLMQGTSHPMYEGANRPLNHAFATDMRALIEEFADVAPVWIHGHTHFTHKTMFHTGPGREEGCEDGLKTVTVASNQRGYTSREGQHFCLDVEPVTV